MRHAYLHAATAKQDQRNKLIMCFCNTCAKLLHAVHHILSYILIFGVLNKMFNYVQYIMCTFIYRNVCFFFIFNACCNANRLLTS